MDREWEMQVRLAVFDHLRRLSDQFDGPVPSAELEKRLDVGRARIAVMSRQQGIHKPAELGAALTLKTSAGNPYKDKVDLGYDGLVRYHYRDASTASPRARAMAEADNRAVRAAKEAGLPVAYLLSVDKGWYLPFAPVQVVVDQPQSREFGLDLTQLGGIDLAEGVVAAESVTRRYQAREVKVRMHQARFRQMVMAAYRRTCAMCSLHHERLLDAAHIVEDSEGGEPTVTNGLALCKIHHAAFDQLVIGIEPGSHRLAVRRDILEEIDGPMLEHGIQGMHGRTLLLPSKRVARPAEASLEQRWERFRAA